LEDFSLFLDAPPEKENGRLAFRPEEVRLTKKENPAGAGNGFSCRIERILPRGVLSEVRLRAGNTPITAMVTTASLFRQGLAENDRVFAAVDAAKLHVL
jgi:molybdopterin-binding protein